MDFVRFSGELAIYYVLIALGGGVLSGFTMMMFASIGINAEWLVGGWVVPCGAAGAVIVGSWLVEAKQSVIENMAPVLTRLFTPLFTVLLLVFLATMAWTGKCEASTSGPWGIRPACMPFAKSIGRPPLSIGKMMRPTTRSAVASLVRSSSCGVPEARSTPGTRKPAGRLAHGGPGRMAFAATRSKGATSSPKNAPGPTAAALGAFFMP
jgi:hypothetical protein